jgi:hypothetical protein
MLSRDNELAPHPRERQDASRPSSSPATPRADASVSVMPGARHASDSLSFVLVRAFTPRPIALYCDGNLVGAVDPQVYKQQVSEAR